LLVELCLPDLDQEQFDKSNTVSSSFTLWSLEFLLYKLQISTAISTNLQFTSLSHLHQHDMAQRLSKQHRRWKVRSRSPPGFSVGKKNDNNPFQGLVTGFLPRVDSKVQTFFCKDAKQTLSLTNL